MKKTPASSARVIALSKKHMASAVAPVVGISDEELRQCRAGMAIIVA